MATGNDERERSLGELSNATAAARSNLRLAAQKLITLQERAVELDVDVSAAHDAKLTAASEVSNVEQQLYSVLNAELARGTVTVGEVAALLKCNEETQARLTDQYFAATERLQVGEGYVLRDDDNNRLVWGTLRRLVPEIQQRGDVDRSTLDMLAYLQPPTEHDDAEESEPVKVRINAAYLGNATATSIMTADVIEAQITVNPSVLSRFNGSYYLSSEYINDMGRMLGALRWLCGDVDQAGEVLEGISGEVRSAVELDYKDGKWAIKRCLLPSDGLNEMQAALAVLKEYVPEAYAELERNVKILMATTDFSTEENDPNGFVMVTERDLLGFAQAATGLRRYEAAALFEAEGQELRAEIEAEAANN